ncbi:hypothetical protein DYBT9623_03073 [Dyadobacter sp. CECT 9623]|jgi:Asp-tRNA(Asn)/Glu-tRNA(Gln) amidotransferase B subunit|uniref:Addiction module component n=1 Tax=Dyadobacter linearis TaxID=2823330 RepID=A0ABN7R8J9_9BACT|nr:hypothetical protein [Dyadobacter sp. CECT 9623]CAG5070528.1 hypothetical protein DYBT9623_03073 [Dyadobacter sp. CECT 9623]
MAITYHIKVKKDYAADLIEDLEKVDAIEVFASENESTIEIADWQKETVLARLKEAKTSPETLISWTQAKERIEKLIS